MHTIHVASECAPFAKVGGLADVIMGLSQELVDQGVNSSILLPRYACIDMSELTFLGKEERFDIFLAGERTKGSIRHYLFRNKIPILLFEHEYWARCSTVYGEDVERFVFFCRAVADWLASRKIVPDLIHVHDWPTALLPIICRSLSLNIPSVFTIHNFEFQGWCQWEDLQKVGLTSKMKNKEWLQQPSSLNLVQAGMLSADIVTTVSPTYAREVMSPEFGRGLENVLPKDRFLGILNGLEYAYWNPEDDPFLEAHYSVRDLQDDIRCAKEINKKKVLESLQIPYRESSPLLCSVTRLTSQKGTELIHGLFEKAEELGVQCILLGSVPDPGVQSLFEKLNKKLRRQGRGAIVLKNDEEMAHQFFAAADMFVAPSLFEPCGLTQLISLRYGTVPVVRHTGGFADTVDEKNGFFFVEPNIESFLNAVMHAVSEYKEKELWSTRMMVGMKQDFSWKKPAQEYLKIYQKLVH